MRPVWGREPASLSGSHCHQAAVTAGAFPSRPGWPFSLHAPAPATTTPDPTQCSGVPAPRPRRTSKRWWPSARRDAPGLAMHLQGGPAPPPPSQPNPPTFLRGASFKRHATPRKPRRRKPSLLSRACSLARSAMIILLAHCPKTPALEAPVPPGRGLGLCDRWLAPGNALRSCGGCEALPPPPLYPSTPRNANVASWAQLA
jgi:hypothetical protein